ncbi:alanine racemase [Nonomuraea sp. NBC_01738]|uniref:alanine racemase n=1 Tax=Nonomuraea sp. NBC_01738 TaxID=2976003 RepID=UPI002E0FD879|nr:alanine racemase [Nonomuraea sp. NBC_01738]
MTTTPAQARIDLAAIRHNVGILRERAGGTPLMGAVKADAYGHGLVPTSEALVAAGVSRLGTAYLREGLALRAAGITVPVLSWILTPGEPFDEALRQDVELSASDVRLLEEIAAAARATGITAKVHLEADTGMSRGGSPLAAWPALVAKAVELQAEGAVEVVGLWSHFASADIPGDPSIRMQLDQFEIALKQAEQAGAAGSHVMRHIANSAAIMTLPEARYDLVRPGIAMYGLSPIPEMGDFGLRQVMTLTARIALAKRVPENSGVSYGLLYVTDRETTLGLVPLGYADGILRHATGRVEVLAGGRRRAIAGRVCMDQFMIDVGDDPLAAGDEVILFGPGKDGESTLQEWADNLGTITHEIVTRLGARVPRVYEGA